MTEQSHRDGTPPESTKLPLMKRALATYGRILDVIVTILIIIMLLAIKAAIKGVSIEYFPQTHESKN